MHELNRIFISLLSLKRVKTISDLILYPVGVKRQYGASILPMRIDKLCDEGEYAPSASIRVSFFISLYFLEEVLCVVH